MCIDSVHGCSFLVYVNKSTESRVAFCIIIVTGDCNIEKLKAEQRVKQGNSRFLLRFDACLHLHSP